MQVTVRIRGEAACFRRPEFARDLVSYPIIPPATARQILAGYSGTSPSAWTLDAIEVLAPIRFSEPVMRENGSRILPLAQVDYLIHADLQAAGELQLIESVVHLGLSDFAGTAQIVREPVPNGLPEGERDADLGWLLFDFGKGAGRKASFCRALMRDGQVVLPLPNSSQLVE
jgi:CRISPR-associated protein Cas5d